VRFKRHNVPIAWRITGGLLVAAIIPLGILAFLGLHRGKRAVEEASFHNLQLTARATALHVDQLIDDLGVAVDAVRNAPGGRRHDRRGASPIESGQCG
jgi:hypothetical protein